VTAGDGSGSGCKAANALLADAREARKAWEFLLLLLGLAIIASAAMRILQLGDLDKPEDRSKAVASAVAAVVSGGDVA
jgi:hypothetical protein